MIIWDCCQQADVGIEGIAPKRSPIGSGMTGLLKMCGCVKRSRLRKAMNLIEIDGVLSSDD